MDWLSSCLLTPKMEGLADTRFLGRNEKHVQICVSLVMIPVIVLVLRLVDFVAQLPNLDHGS